MAYFYSTLFGNKYVLSNFGLFLILSSSSINSEGWVDAMLSRATTILTEQRGKEMERYLEKLYVGSSPIRIGSN